MSRLAVLLVILVLVVGFYFGRQVVRFYYDYYEFMGLMEAQAKHASMSNDAQIKKTLVRFAQTNDIPLRDLDRDIQIYRADGAIILEAKYEEVLYFDLKELVPGDFIESNYDWDLWTFPFHPYVKMRVKE